MLPACIVCGELGHSQADCRQLTSHQHEPIPLDFNEAGRQLLDRLGAPAVINKFSPLDPIWRAPTGIGAVYVGSMQATKGESMLRQAGITHVVNCMMSPCLNIQPGISYFNFDLEDWRDELPSVSLSMALINGLAGACRQGTMPSVSRSMALDGLAGACCRGTSGDNAAAVR